MNWKALLGTALILAVLTLATLSYLPVNAQNSSNAFPPSTNINFSSTTKFVIPSSNGMVMFASGGSYANACLNGDVWDFADLFVTGGSSALPNIFGVTFSVSAKNCNVTITHLDALNAVPPFPGELDYTVSGVGTQAFNLHYSNLGLLNWTVYIDGAVEPKGDGWTISPDGWLTVTGASSNVSIHWAEVSTIAFTSSDNFLIPSCNSSINFASDGTCLGEPSLANNTWTFQNLALDGSVPSGVPLWTFSIWAQNSNVTIDSYNPGAFAGAVNGSAWLNYTVAGVGIQNVSLGYGNSNGNIGPDVYIDCENRTQGNGWFLLNDGWLEVAGASSNISIYYPPNPALYNLPPPIPDTVAAPFNLYFFAILAGIIVAAVITVFVIIFCAPPGILSSYLVE
jgi:hypothetical protein